MRAALLAAALVAACSSKQPAPADRADPGDQAPSDQAPSAGPAPADQAAAEANRADCERVLAHTWKLVGGDPDSDKLRGAKHERELAECMQHITPAARDCVLAATAPAQLGPCEKLGK